MDPIREAENYYDRIAYEDELRIHVERKMKEQRQECIDYLRTLVRSDLAEDFSKILASAYEYGNPEAEKIANKYNFSESDFLAIDENFSEYRNYLVSEGWNV